MRIPPIHHTQNTQSNSFPGQTEVVDNNAADTDDFLARERAALGDDADQFATPNDQAATVEDDDLLGGDDYVPQQGASAEISGFESSFPAIDTQNEVQFAAFYATELMTALTSLCYRQLRPVELLPAPALLSQPRATLAIINQRRNQRLSSKE